MLKINDKYSWLREWVETLPEHFDGDGEVIYHERNTIRRVEHGGLSLVVKRYRRPSAVNRLIYTLFRKPKAVRAYENALRMKEVGIETPEAVALLTCGRVIGESYLVTMESRLRHNFYDFRDGVTEGREETIRGMARFAAKMHRSGVLHLDFSPGNILYDNVDGEMRFETVDINRMRFGRVTWSEGCRNFARLWGKRRFFEIVAEEYAKETGHGREETLAEILEGRRRFWQHRSSDHFVTDESFRIGVVVSTYNNPEWLEKCLWGLMNQRHSADEVIIADDGSDERTKRLVERYKAHLPLKHVWHEDKGFRKTTILNRAVEESESDYLIFLDQDLVARRDFVRQHYIHARKGRFVSGGAVKISEETSRGLTMEDVRSQRCFGIKWLDAHGTRRNWKMSKLWRNGVICWVMNRITPTKATWNGGNSSTWREYILRAKGFDERMRYGAEDREFGTRLENAGVRGIQLRYGIPVLHLWHTRPYRNEEDWRRNREIWSETKRGKVTVTGHGMR